MRKILIFLVLALVFGYTVYNQTKQSEIQTAGSSSQGATDDKSGQVSQTGVKPASTFSLKGLDGKIYEFTGPREKPIVINFWASWCGPCQQEAPDLKKMYETYKGQVDFYAVNLTSDDKLENAKAFVEKNQFTFPILLDEEGKVANSYHIQAIPTTYFIDKNGNVQQMIIGMINPTLADQYMKQITQ